VVCLGVSAVLSGASAFEVLVKMPPLPIGSEEPAKTGHGDADHRDDQTGAEHGPTIV
jgi:hypothetical protein